MPLSEDTYQMVYESRYAIGLARQEYFAGYLARFDQFLTELHRKHPYGRDKALYEKCSEVACFISGDTQWIPAHPKQSVLYRIANIKKTFFDNDDFRVVVREDAPGISPIRTEADISDLFDQLSFESSPDRNPIRWLNLSDYLEEYKAKRGFTWWTTLALSDAADAIDLLKKAHLIGLLNNWVGEYSLIMKLDLPKETQSIDSPTVWVPSVIDAYLSSIFKAQDQDKRPAHGTAINIKNPAEEGADEYVVRGNILSNIEFIPFRVPKLDWRHKEVEYGLESEDIYRAIIKNH